MYRWYRSDQDRHNLDVFFRVLVVNSVSRIAEALLDSAFDVFANDPCPNKIGAAAVAVLPLSMLIERDEIDETIFA